MKQLLQNLSNGETSLADVPCPKNIKSNILIATTKSVVSTGTERMLVNFGKANYINKAKQQPDKVKMVLNKISSDGLMTTFDAVRSKLDQPLPLGYCNAGVILESDVYGFETGERVVSNGNHAEVVRVPKNLCVKIPDNVNDESARYLNKSYSYVSDQFSCYLVKSAYIYSLSLFYFNLSLPFSLLCDI